MRHENTTADSSDQKKLLQQLIARPKILFAAMLLIFIVHPNTLLAQNGVNTTVAPVTPATTSPPAVASPNTTAPVVVNQPDGTQVTIQTLFCPSPNQLIKNGLFWGTATGGWKSYSESFDTAISSFIGAQWVGVNVGKMICIYKGNLSMSFPITIQNDTLSQTPAGGLWGVDQGGYLNCHSNNLADCPFVVKTTVVNMQQIYQSLDFYKNKPSPLNQNSN